jgi:hypothetical protein
VAFAVLASQGTLCAGDRDAGEPGLGDEEPELPPEAFIPQGACDVQDALGEAIEGKDSLCFTDGDSSLLQRV